MKILQVIASLARQQGGPSSAVLGLSRALVQSGHEVTIFTTNMNGRGDFRLRSKWRHILDVPVNQPVYQDGIGIWHFAVNWPSWWITSWPMARALSTRVKEFDIVHIHSVYLFHTSAAAYYCRRARVPYLIRPHGTLDPFLRRRKRLGKWMYEWLIERRNLNHAAAVHYTSDEEKRRAEPLNLRIPAAVIPLGVNLDEFRNLPLRGTFRDAHPEIGDKKIILFLGRINFQKGLDLLAKAFNQLAATHADIYLVLAGPDNEGYSRQVIRWLKQGGGLERTRFTGGVYGDERLAVLRDADVWVLPSYMENFGVAVVEALACGLPVVVSDRVHIWRKIQEARAGLVVNCSVAALVEAIGRLLEDKELRMSLGRQARHLAAEQFGWDRVAAQYTDLYEKLKA